MVFFAAGFETTTAPLASLLVEGVPDNLLVLLSGRLTWPAVAMLLDSETPGFDALVAPGHVSTVMGPEEWAFVPERHGLPAAVAGFTPASLLAALYSVLRQRLEGRTFLDNCYPEVVRPGRQPHRPSAPRLGPCEIVDANWRGIGIIPGSGYALSESLRRPRRPGPLPGLRGHRPPARGRDAARVRLRQGGAGQALPGPVPAVRRRLHPAHARRALHGVGRGRLPHLVVERGQDLTRGVAPLVYYPVLKY